MLPVPVDFPSHVFSSLDDFRVEEWNLMTACNENLMIIEQ